MHTCNMAYQKGKLELERRLVRGVGLGFACLALYLASDLHRPTQSHSDCILVTLSLRLPQIHLVSLKLTQIH